MSDRGDEDVSDALRDMADETDEADEADEIAHGLPELICDPADESAEEAAMHIEDPGRS